MMSIIISLGFIIVGTIQVFHSATVGLICWGFAVIWYILYLVEHKILENDRLRRDYIMNFKGGNQ